MNANPFAKVLGLSMLVVSMLSSHVLATSERLWLELPPQSLASALQLIASKYQLQLAYPSVLAEDLVIPPVRAYVNAQEAFQRILRPYQLQAVFDQRHSITIRRSVKSNLTVSTTRYKSSGSVIEEIIVTAQKRPQSLQKLAMAATVFSDNDIHLLHLQPANQLANQVPNMMIKTAIGSASPIFTIRGVGLNEYAANGSPSVGVYLDQVSLASNAMMDLQMVDFERIEVLKGPQGDIFGRNTTGGAVSFISRRPQLDNSLEFEVKLGNFQTRTSLAIANLKLSEQLAVRLALLDNQQDKGFFHNRYLNKRHGKIDRSSYRLGLSWLPTDNKQEFYVNIHGSRDNSENALYENFAINDPSQNNQSCGATSLKESRALGCVNWLSYRDGDDDWYQGDYNLNPRINDNSEGAVINYWRRFDGFKVDLLVGYQRYLRDVDEEADASPFQIAEVFYNSLIKQRSYELRLSSLLKNSANFWMVGLYHADDRNTTADRYNYRQHPLRLTELLVDYQQDTDSDAIFFRYSRNLSRQWEIEWGLRYTSEQRQFVGGTIDLDPLAQSKLSTGGALAYSNEKFTANKMSGRFSLNFNLNDNVFAYLSLSQGFKSGGFNGFWVESEQALKPYRAEELKAYEFGLKTNLLNHSLQLNSAFFYYDYRNLQLFDYDPNIVSFFIDNAPRAAVVGFESELWWKPYRGLELKLGLGLIDTETKQYVSPAGINYSGRRLANSPSWSLNGVMRKQWPITNRLELAAQLDFNGQDQFFFNAANEALTQQASYFIFNARFSLTREKSEVSLWVKNISDQRYQIEALQSSAANIMVNPSSPRTWGLSLTNRW